MRQLDKTVLNLHDRRVPLEHLLLPSLDSVKQNDAFRRKKDTLFDQRYSEILDTFIYVIVASLR